MFAKLSEALIGRYINSDRQQIHNHTRQDELMIPLETIIQGLWFTAGQRV